jgi:thioredoxin reductase (NADPH)
MERGVSTRYMLRKTYAASPRVIMSGTTHAKVIVLGSGPAGCTAAIYAARAMLNPLMIMGMQPGGQLTITTEVENYPGFRSAIQGPWLMQEMQAQAEHVGTSVEYDLITKAELSKRPFVLTGDSGTSYTCDSLIIATGAQAKWLGLPSEEAFKGFGVSACATCDGFFFKDKSVVVVGGGNTAVEEALFLTNFAKQVTLVHRRDRLRADKTNQMRFEQNPKTSAIWNSEIEEVLGGGNPKAVTGVRLKNLATGARETLSCDGLFIAIGHIPATEIFRGAIDMDAEGYILTAPDSTKTNIQGVFAAGDVKDRIFRQAVTAAGMGCMAALEAERFLAHEN